jgi:hypothetical protein
MTDDLDEFLGPKPSTDDAAAREAVLRRTARVVRRRPWIRRAKLLATAVGLVAAGGAVGWLVKPAPGRVTEYVVLPIGVVLPATEPAPPPPTEYVSAEQIELQAEQASDRATAAALYRQAGDRYLADRNDSPQAARCYRLFLMRAGPDARAVSADDSWLLIALKRDQKEANRNDPQGL